MDDILENIYNASLKFLEPVNVEETYKIIADEATKLVKADNASILLVEGGEFKRVYSSNPIWATIKTRRKGFSYHVYKSGRPRILSDEELSLVHPEIKKIRIKSSMIIPLTNQGKSIGVLNLQSKEYKHFTQKELNIIKLIGSFASLAIRKSQLYQEIRNAVDTRDLFLSMAAHEFRTPVTSISGYTQLLRTKVPFDNSSVSRWIDSLGSEVHRLTMLVNELLEVNRIKSGEFHYFLKECSLKDLLARAVNNLRFTEPQRKVMIIDELVNKKDTVIGDSDKLLQVIGNLLENASKFSTIDEPIFVELKKKNSDFIIRIIDKGIGIKKSEIPFIFSNYIRGSNAHREGMGLGLFLVKNIIEKHQGELKVKSKLNKGTTVEVKLPSRLK